MSMKIVAGIGCIDDYEAFAEAGADELFAGYVPHDFISSFGRRNPVNRREVIYYNVQLGSESELLILQKMIEKYGVEISITLNALYYEKKQYEELLKLVSRLSDMGYKRFTVADSQLIELLGNIEGLRLEVSGELGELNRGVLSNIMNTNVKRIIFPRQTSISEMKLLISSLPEDIEFEAFALNEKCHFTGAYCNSLHCDELCHMCRVPYRLEGTPKRAKEEPVEPKGFGATGCAICDLWSLKSIGVTHLKIVGRGNYTEDSVRDIKNLRRALTILEESKTEEEYLYKVRKELFPQGCSNNCYRYCAK